MTKMNIMTKMNEDEHHDEDEHEGHAPTVFANEAVEYGATFDISNDEIQLKRLL